MCNNNSNMFDVNYYNTFNYPTTSNGFIQYTHMIGQNHSYNLLNIDTKFHAF